MTVYTKESLRASMKAAEVELSRIRGARSIEGSDITPARIAQATEALINARIAVWVFDATGDAHGLVVRDDQVMGSIPVKIPPGVSQEERARIIDDAVVGPLQARADETGVVLAAAPSRFTRERPGRDEEGRTILDVRAQLEGDRLVPAVSKASRRR